MSIHWHAPSPPATTSIDLRIEAVPLPAAWNEALARPATVAVDRGATIPSCQSSCESRLRPPRVVSIPIVAARGAGAQFRISRAGGDCRRCRRGQPRRALAQPAVARRRQHCARHCTRIKPPGDVIKLADRLHYVLQPSLESLLAEGSLAFPVPPVSVPVRGHRVSLSASGGDPGRRDGAGQDDAGHHGHPAVAPPRRGAERAAGLPQAAGDQLAAGVRRLGAGGAGDGRSKATRPSAQWQWRLPDVPLRIANYELLLRDRELLAGRHFDLVVLDESQRIKNRASSTSEVVCSISRKRNWALTGTPVENSADDLLGIFEFLAPGFLSPEMKPRSMGRTIGDYVLRRTKDQVLTRPAAEADPRRAARSDARTARKLPAGRGGGRACG